MENSGNFPSKARRQIVLPITLIMSIVVIGMTLIVPKAQQHLQNISIENATEIGEKIAEQHQYLQRSYSQDILTAIQQYNIDQSMLTLEPGPADISLKHEDVETGSSVPMSMIHDLGRRANRQDELQIQLYSQYPFPHRKDRELDAFQKEAWYFFSQEENQFEGAVFRRRASINIIVDDEEKTTDVVRVAVANKMNVEACVSCHNQYPNTPKNNWVLGDVAGVLEVRVPLSQPFREFEETLTTISAFVLGIFALIWLVTWVSISRTIAPLSKLSTSLHRLSIGDVESRPLVISESNEIGALQSSFNRLQRKCASLVSSVDSYYATLEKTASTLADMAQLQQAGIAEQLITSEETKESLMTLLESSKEMAEISQIVLENAEITQENASTIATYIDKLSRHVSGIGEISNLIKEISIKSDLLALNAALEGTKAGKAGQGFSLVAIQMKQLSEQVMESTKEIKALTSDITKTTRGSIIASQETNKIALETTSSAQQITLATEKQKEGTQQVSTAIDMIVQSANETSMATFSIVEISFDLISLSNRLKATLEEFHEGEE